MHSVQQVENIKRLAVELVDDFGNIEYVRGICELIADIDPIEGVAPADRADRVKADLMWMRLGDVCINSEEEIDEPFLHFPVGTELVEIWAWFEETFSLSVAKDLMRLK